MNYVGIDGGLYGALVVLTEDGRLHSAHRTPITAGVHDLVAMRAIVAGLPHPYVVTYETPIRVNRNSTSDSGYLGLVASLKFWKAAFGKIPLEMVHPSTWESALLRGVQGKGKQRAINWCRVFLKELDLYPGRCTTPCDGLSDAACLAEYGRRIHNLTTKG